MRKPDITPHPSRPEAERQAGPPEFPGTDDLLTCARCRSRLMYPGVCEERGDHGWYLELVCPECGGITADVFDLDMLDLLDRELDRAESEIKADLARLTRANMHDYVTRFVSALNAGAIEPMDFTV